MHNSHIAIHRKSATRGERIETSASTRTSSDSRSIRQSVVLVRDEQLLLNDCKKIPTTMWVADIAITMTPSTSRTAASGFQTWSRWTWSLSRMIAMMTLLRSRSLLPRSDATATLSSCYGTLLYHWSITHLRDQLCPNDYPTYTFPKLLPNHSIFCAHLSALSLLFLSQPISFRYCITLYSLSLM